MNGELRPARAHLLTFVIAVVGALLTVAVLVGIMVKVTRPEPVGAARAEERKKVLIQTRNEEAQVLNNYDRVGAGPGFVRMKIEDAMKLTIKEYQNPAAARTNLIARADKAGAPPPAPPPPPPNKYE
jgi:Flp pilus assembly protein TadB